MFNIALGFLQSECYKSETEHDWDESWIVLEVTHYLFSHILLITQNNPGSRLHKSVVGVGLIGNNLKAGSYSLDFLISNYLTILTLM